MANVTSPSYVDKEAFLEDYKQGLIAFPVYVKPVRGSASIGISQVRDLTTLDLLFEHYDGLMIQEFLRGQEIGADEIPASRERARYLSVYQPTGGIVER